METDLSDKVLRRFIEALVSAPPGSDRSEMLFEAVAYAYAALGEALPTHEFLKKRVTDLAFQVVAQEFLTEDLGASLNYVNTGSKTVAVAMTIDQDTSDMFAMACEDFADKMWPTNAPGGGKLLN